MQIIALGFLMAAVLMVWHSGSFYWVIPLILFVFVSLFSGWMEPIALVSIFLLFSIVLFYQHAETAAERIFSTVTLILISIATATHLFPGFGTILLVEQVWLSEHKDDISIGFQADSAIVGLGLLVLFKSKLISSLGELRSAFRIAWPLMVCGIGAIYLFGLAINFIGIDITLSVLVFPWMLSNLFFFVIAEELLFRGVIQNEIEQLLSYPNSKYIALLVTSFLFGALHLHGGWKYGLLATLAGVLYGTIYLKTRRIEMSMLCHLVLNTGVVLFFSTQ